jgi:hypothetical protein
MATCGSPQKSQLVNIYIFRLEIWLTFVACLSPVFRQRRYALEDFEQEINSLSPTIDDGGTEIKSAKMSAWPREPFYLDGPG